jgi:hypothetical protein
MTPELENILTVYLGELLYYHEHEADWIRKDELARKLNALYVLLDIKDNVETTFDKIKNIIQNGRI